jgi:hypothetical protein
MAYLYQVEIVVMHSDPEKFSQKETEPGPSSGPLKKVDLLLAAGVAFTLPFPFIPLNNGFIIAWAIVNLVHFIKSDAKVTQGRKYLLALAPPVIYYAVLFLSRSSCGDEECFSITGAFLERQVLFAVFPIIALGARAYEYSETKIIFNVFTVSLAVQAILLCLYPDMESVDKPYLGMFAAFAIAYCFNDFIVSAKVWGLVRAFPLIILLVLIEAKTASFSALACILIVLPKVMKAKTMALFAVGGLLMLGLVVVSQLKFDPEYLLAILHVKTFSWKCAWEAYLKSGNYFFGATIGYAERALIAVYHTYPDWMGYMGYNAHNQFFETLLAQGVVGLMLLLTWFGELFNKAIKTGNQLLLYLVVVSVLACVTESIFWRQKGIVFFVFFAAMLIKNSTTSDPRIQAAVRQNRQASPQ